MALFVFLASAAVIVYVVVGYPLLVRLLARYRARPVHQGAITPAVSILVPVHNGAFYLRDKLQSIAELDYPAGLLETIVLADGCTDATAAIAGEFPNVALVSLPRGGKPAALNEGFRHARHEILVLTDVRQRLAPDSIRRLVRNFADPSVGTVSGGYSIDRGRTSDEADVNRYWLLESWLRDRLAEIDSMLGATGPFYAIRRELAVQMPPTILLDDMYLPLTAFFKGYRLVTDPSAKFYDVPMTVRTEFRRKVRTLAGNYQLLKYMPALLTSANRMRWHYISYKLGRLLLPFALAAVFVSGLYLPSPVNVVVTTAQLACYLLAGLDRFVPERAVFKRLSSPLHTFCVMMAAAVCALSILFIRPDKLWVVTSTIAPDPR